MIFGRCRVHTTRSGAMQIVSKFYHNKHLTLETIGPMGVNDPKIHPFHLRHVDRHLTHECLGDPTHHLKRQLDR